MESLENNSPSSKEVKPRMRNNIIDERNDRELENTNVLSETGHRRLEKFLTKLDSYDNDEVLWTNDYFEFFSVKELKRVVDIAIKRSEICSQLENRLLKEYTKDELISNEDYVLADETINLVKTIFLNEVREQLLNSEEFIKYYKKFKKVGYETNKFIKGLSKFHKSISNVIIVFLEDIEFDEEDLLAWLKDGEFCIWYNEIEFDFGLASKEKQVIKKEDIEKLLNHNL